MVASRQLENPIYRGIDQKRGREFVALAQVIRKTPLPFLREHIVPTAECVGVDLLEFAAPETAEVVSGKKNFKKAANSVGRQTLRKQLSVSSSKNTTNTQLKVIPAKSAK